jgi:hypothetical protein
MANAAFIIPKRWPKVLELDALVKKAVLEKFPAFTVRSIDGGWAISHRLQPDDLSFNIWVSKCGKKQALQIPHRHSYNFMWWVEYEIRERLAQDLEARQYDEGVGKTQNCCETYATFSDYLRAVYSGDFLHLWVGFCRLEVWVLPPDLQGLLGDLFKRA